MADLQGIFAKSGFFLVVIVSPKRYLMFFSVGAMARSFRFFSPGGEANPRSFSLFPFIFSHITSELQQLPKEQ